MVDPDQVRREVAAIEAEQAARLAEGTMLVDLRWRRLWLGVAVVALLGAAWMWRYDVVVTSGPAYLRLDRWTGHVYGCHSQGCVSFIDAVKGPAPPPQY